MRAEVGRPAVAVNWARSRDIGRARSAAGGERGGREARRGRSGSRRCENFDAEASRQHRILRRAGAGARDRRCGGGQRDRGGSGGDSRRRFPRARGGITRAWCVRSITWRRPRRRSARCGPAGGSAVEMEAGGVAERAAAQSELPFYCIRVVTDLAGEDMANDFNLALRPDGHFATMSILSRALRDPLVRLPELVRLRNRCVRASRALGDFIADCRF